ncbi:MAG: YidC/Oxa1 family membrane protein insertase [bacterium]|nr:YidC/Oxa1 family membrane protein insertase [bacterium]
MKKNKIIMFFLMLILFSGCTKQLTNGNKVITNPTTGQSITENILCKPKNLDTIKIYEDNSVDLKKLPDCEKFKINSGGYDGLWDSFVVKPLAWLILKLGNYVKSYGLSLILVSLAIRIIAYPITRKTAIQSELMKNAKPELDKLESKYKDKTDQESLMKKNQEMMLIYKKYDINPISGCLFAFIQLPLFIGFLEAINRVPAIFEEKFLLFQLGTTPKSALFNGDYMYLILILIVSLTTYFSFKFNATAVGDNNQTKSMNRMMVIMITVMSIFMTAALDIYWITTNLFTVVQNILVKRGIKNGKA